MIILINYTYYLHAFKFKTVTIIFLQMDSFYHKIIISSLWEQTSV